MHRTVGRAALVALLLTFGGCGGADDGSDSTDVANDSPAVDAAGDPDTDTAGDDASTDASEDLIRDGEADEGRDTRPADASLSDARPLDADPADGSRDARSDTIADANLDSEGCTDGTPRCDGCTFDFTAADPERPTVRIVRIANDSGTLRVSNARVVASSPRARFSQSWLNYIARVARGWTAAEDRTAFTSVSGFIPIEAGEAFEVEVEFGALNGEPTGCPSPGACGRVEVEYTRCDGSIGEVEIGIRR